MRAKMNHFLLFFVLLTIKKGFNFSVHPLALKALLIDKEVLEPTNLLPKLKGIKLLKTNAKKKVAVTHSGECHTRNQTRE